MDSRIVSGALLGARRVGVRLGPNSGLGGGDKMYALLFDADTGELLSFMGFPFGTSANGGGGGDRGKTLWRGKILSDWDCSASGRNAFGILKGLLSVRPIKEIYVSSRDPERRAKFCEEGEKLLGISVRGVDNPEQAVRGMDVVLTATNSLTPIFPEDWVEAGNAREQHGQAD